MVGHLLADRPAEDRGRLFQRVIAAAMQFDDALAEGVLILDDEERMLMANRAFAGKMPKNFDPELGRSASDLPWLSPATRTAVA